MNLKFDPKTTAAFPVPEYYHAPGLSQYAEIAARFHAAFITDGFTTPMSSVAGLAFDHADAFFAELAKRTAP